jgi:FkbM family methyltransferase
LFNGILNRIPFFSKLLKQQSILSIISDQLNYIVHFENNNFILEKNNLNIFIRKNTSDLDVFYQVLFCKEYKPTIDLICNQLNLTVTTIIDIGSNIGLATLYFNEFFPNARIISIEPDEGNFRILGLNTHPFSNIEILQSAIWDNSKKLSKDNSFRDGRDWSTSFKEYNSNIDIDFVNAKTISDILIEKDISHVSLLKIDIEGAEGNIFSNEENVKFLNVVDVIALEIHDEVSDRITIHKILKSYNFFIIDYNETTLAFKLNLLN